MGRGFVAIAEVELRLPGSATLKDRRSALARLRNGIVERFGASVSEVGGRDRADQGDLLVAIALQTQTATDEAVQRLERWLDERDDQARLVQARVVTPEDVE
jgi:uncharacterized protein YlxP (DUF503 family)